MIGNNSSKQKFSPQVSLSRATVYTFKMNYNTQNTHLQFRKITGTLEKLGQKEKFHNDFFSIDQATQLLY